MIPPPTEPRSMERLCAAAAPLARWFRYRCHGFERIPHDRPVLLVGYHGRPAFDMYLLLALLWRRRRRTAWGITHRTPMAVPWLRPLAHALQLYDGSDDGTAAILARGDLICVLPGGTRECFRSSRVLYRVDWGPRRGYLRLARRHGMCIVPVASSGVDEFYRVYGEGYRNSRRFFGTDLLPLCLPLGLFGVPFPLGLPRPVQVRQHVGWPLDVDGPPGCEEDPDWIEAMHARVSGTVQSLLHEARGTGAA